MTTEDFAAALGAFAIGFTAAVMSPRNQTANELLEDLANELHDLASKVPGTPAAEALEKTVQFLMRSEPQ